MFNSLKRPKPSPLSPGSPVSSRDYGTMENNNNVSPITRTEGGSVSTIRHFVFGVEKNGDSWKFNSLSHHWKKKTVENEGPGKLKSPSFRSPKKNFFQNWTSSKSAFRYASTPDLNSSENQFSEKLFSGKSGKLSGRPSVKKLVQDFENSVSKTHAGEPLPLKSWILPSECPASRLNKSYSSSQQTIAPFQVDSFAFEIPSIQWKSVTNHHSVKNEISSTEVKESGSEKVANSISVNNFLNSEMIPLQVSDLTKYHPDQIEYYPDRIKYYPDQNIYHPDQSKCHPDQIEYHPNQSKYISVSTDEKLSRICEDEQKEERTTIQSDRSDGNINPFPSHPNILLSDNLHNNNLSQSYLLSDNLNENDSQSDYEMNPIESSFYLRNHMNVGELNSRSLAIPLSESRTHCLCDEVTDECETTNHLKNELIIKKTEATIVIQEPGRFLARWVPVEDLSSRDGDSPNEASGTDAGEGAGGKEGKAPKARRPTERRESTRFQSAARILRSLGRNRDDDGSGRGKEAEEGAGMSRTNPHYHSEGKGANKRSPDKESNGVSHKERSRSFCDKPEAKRRYLQQENKLLRQEAKVRLDLAEISSLTMQSPPLSAPSSDQCIVESPAAPSLQEVSSDPAPTSCSPRRTDLEEEIVYENVASLREESPALVQNTIEKPDGEPQINVITILESDKDRRISRKLTKDSGYETSPYSEGDYANLELITIEKEAEEGRRVDNVNPSSSSDENGIPLARDSCQKNLPVNASVDESLGKSEIAQEVVQSPHDIAPSLSHRRSTSLQRYPSAESLTTFADSLVVSLPSSSPSATLLPAHSTPSLSQYAIAPSSTFQASAENYNLNGGHLQASKSTPNLEDTEDDIMVTKKLTMYSYLQGSTPSSGKGSANPNRNSGNRYWDPTSGTEDTFNQTDYAHHLRSSSYQILHSRQLSTGSFHSRQHSNASNYSDDDGSPRGDIASPPHHHQSHSLIDRSRCFSFDNLGLESSSHSVPWNISEPDLSLAPPLASSSFSHSQKYEKGQISPSSPAVPLTSKKSPANCGSGKLASSPPPPPVRDASSLKYIRYGPGHEKFPSWPVPAGATSHVVPQGHQSSHDANISGLPDASSAFLSPPQGSHRSHSWTEQSEYPKEKCGGYARPFLKRQFSPSFQKQLLTVMEKCEKISPEVFKSRHPDEILKSSAYSLIDNYLQQSTYYPPYDREGRGIDDKDYSIPSPPERDPGMGEAHLSQVTVAQLEEHARRCDYVYGDYPHGDFPQITPLLDQLRQESYTWDGASERDSGRGESESVSDSRYSNGRESVTTVVTNSSSASSSETLKWHGSLSDVSIMSGHSRDAKGDQNIVHSARVQAPQRQNSESVLYYGLNGRGKSHSSKGYEVRSGREGVRGLRDTEGGYPRPYRDAKWSREVERNNEVNNLKKFPSYSYTQPLSQINEAPLAESREALPLTGRSPKSPTVDFSKPPSVAERINELERQSRSTVLNDVSARWPRDHSEPRDVRRYREERHRDLSLSHDVNFGSDLRKNASERDLRIDTSRITEPKGDLKPPTAIRSPSSVVGTKHHPCKRRDSDESMLSSDSSLHSFNEADISSSTSYTYLDPDKRCKVPDATLKSIQKQALLSFYERKTGKSFNAGSSNHISSHNSSVTSKAPSTTDDLIHPEWAGKSLRGDRGGRAGKGMARLGRVPDPELGDNSPCKPIRRRSVSGREANEDTSREAGSPLVSSSFSSESTSRREMPPNLPAKPQQLNSSTFNSSFLVHSSPKDESKNVDERELLLEEERRSSLTRTCHELPSSSSTSSPNQETHPHIHQPSALDGEVIPSLPPLADEAPPKPPDRPPKRPNLRSLFHAPDNSLTALPSGKTEKQNPEAADIRRIEESANELRNLSPARPYFYRKPPAPDPPQTPPDSPSTLNTPSVSRSPPSSCSNVSPPKTSLLVPASSGSRSSTPELPPPPPPPVTEEEEVVVSDEPLPPPPSEVASETSTANHHTENLSSKVQPMCNGTYHKDSYMAHRREWKTGYEGRYRRTHSPSASDRNVNHVRSREHMNNINNNNNKNNIKSSQSMTKPSICKQPSYHTNGNLRSAVSTSSLMQRPSSSLDNDTLINDNHHYNGINNNNNGWSAHPRQTSTTVNFTAEELRAFKARRAAHEAVSSTGELRLEMPSLESSNISLSPLRPITRAFSMGEPLYRLEDSCHDDFALDPSGYANNCDNMSPTLSITEPHFHNSNSTLNSSSTLSRSSSSSDNCTPKESPSSPSNSIKACPASPTSPVLHDGPVTAHPATVTEEHSNPSSPIVNRCLDMPRTSPTSTLPPTSLSENFTHSSLPLRVSTSLPSPTLVLPTALTSLSSLSFAPAILSSSSLSLVSTSSTSSIPNIPLASSNTNIPINLTMVASTVTQVTSNSKPNYLRALSSTGTSPSMTSPILSPEEGIDRANIVVLSYGRTRNPEEVDCDRLSIEFVEMTDIDSKLQALLAPGPEYKSMANYMNDVFTLEMRKDLLCRSHANHPDLLLVSTETSSLESPGASKESIPIMNGHSELEEDTNTRTNDRAPLPADSAYFTTSECKAKLLSKIRESPLSNDSDSTHIDSQELIKKKEELVTSITRKLDILRAEQSLIKEEISLNIDLGLQVTTRVEARAKAPEAEKYKLHVEEIDKITSLLLGLSGRLARAENALLLQKDEPITEERRILESKRDKLSEQLEEAKKLKENIDRRAVQVSRNLNQYLSEEEYADYDHFIKMKAKLIMDAKEIDDKIKLGEEQLQALLCTMANNNNL